MTKITTEQLARTAFVYVRQSTRDQLVNNHESRRRQYGLVAPRTDFGLERGGACLYSNFSLGASVTLHGANLLLADSVDEFNKRSVRRSPHGRRPSAYRAIADVSLQCSERQRSATSGRWVIRGPGAEPDPL
ncbi:MAG TPA: hypothetical protein VKI44_35355 [Acetobacteraceae bacterium]|nr:hypothetical protein [Acetobacteraceae bacterium]